jgi:hypothetical protein
MTPPRPHRSSTDFSCYLLLAVALVLISAAPGCKSGAAPHTSDPKLTGIDELLAAQLPVGTPRSRVVFFLNSRGYAISPSPDSQSIVATVHHINTNTLQPEAARITFHFDANDKLTSYDLEPANTLPTT